MLVRSTGSQTVKRGCEMRACSLPQKCHSWTCGTGIIFFLLSLSVSTPNVPHYEHVPCHCTPLCNRHSKQRWPCVPHRRASLGFRLCCCELWGAHEKPSTATSPSPRQEQTLETPTSICPVPALRAHSQQRWELPPRMGCGPSTPVLRHAYFLPPACLDASSRIHKTGLHQTDQPPSPCYYPSTSSYKRLLLRARLTGGTIAATKAFSVSADDINLVL